MGSGGNSVEALLTDIVRRVLSEIDLSQLQTDDRLAFDTAEAARLISLTPRQLQDEFRAGRIQASRVRGNKLRFTREDLRDYLNERRV